MDADIVTRRDRLGRKAKELIVYPDADVSEPEIDDQDDGPSYAMSSDSDSGDEEKVSATMPSTSSSKKSTSIFNWKKKQVHVDNFRYRA